MKIVAPVAFAVVAALALGASAQPPPGAPPPPPRPKESCFWVSRVENFAAVDQENLYLRVGVHDVYRAKLFSTCLDLDWVHRLALITPGSSLVCTGPNPNASVVVTGDGPWAHELPGDRLWKS